MSHPLADASDDGEPSRSPAILVVLFNRPAVVGELIDALRPARPARLFVFADGPRPDHPSDVQRCAQARAALDQVDWMCEISRCFRDDNVGLKAAMVGAIDWFFSHVESGIILEDDCIPHPDFLAFAGDLLERYRDVSEVMGISGVNMAPHERFGPYSYFFASSGHIWGWATWRRAWQGFDIDLQTWPAIRDDFYADSTPLRRALGVKFDAAYDGTKHTWARAWHYHVARRRGLVVVPSVNLVRNIGLGPDATHTTSTRHSLARLAVGELADPLVHPEVLAANRDYDAHLARFHTWTRRRRTREKLRSLTQSRQLRSGRTTAQ